MKELYRLMLRLFAYIRLYGLKNALQRTVAVLTTRLPAPSYQGYAEVMALTRRELAAQRAAAFPYMPRVSVVMPTYRTPPDFIAEAVASVRAQTYANWELCIADGASGDETLFAFLRQAEREDARIRVRFLTENLGVSGNTNAAVAMATGEYVAFMDHDDTLTPDALYEVVSRLNEHRADVVYSDEDKLAYNGRSVFNPHFKPDFSPHTMLSINYMCHLVVVRRAVLEQAGPLDPAFDGAQDHDLLLRVTEQTQDVAHIQRVLYHWRENRDSLSGANLERCQAAGRRAVAAHLERRGIPVAAVEQDELMGYRVRYAFPVKPRVSVILPTCDHRELLSPCMDALLASTYGNLEIILVENNSKEPETFALYRELEQKGVRVLTYDKPGFNFSALVNFGAAAATGAYLVLLNNDVMLTCPQWVEEMLGVCQQEGVGAVGGRLWYPDNMLQHAGLIMGVGGVANSAYQRLPRGTMGYFGRSCYVCDVAAVTGALLMTPKAVYDRLGGFDQTLAVAFNDVDYCLCVREAGLTVVFTPYAEGVHYESASRGYDWDGEKRKRLDREDALLRAKHGALSDPYYNSNFDQGNTQYLLSSARYRARKEQRRKER